MRRLVRALIALVVVGTVPLLGAAWYYSGEIRSDALSVDHGLPLNVTISSASQDAVTLRTADDPPAQLGAEGVYGLSWNGGYGQVGEIGRSGRRVVTREMRILRGAAPRSGSRGRLESYAFPAPHAAGLRVHDVTFRSELGRFPAWHVPGRPGSWVIVMHGQNAERREGLRLARAANDAGYTVFVPAYRNDDDAPSSPEEMTLHGAAEWRDLEAAVAYARKNGARNIVLAGNSMGGAIVMSFLVNSQRTEAVKGVILDAPMLDLVRTIEFGASRRDLPLIGMPLPGVLTDAATALAALRYDLRWDAMGYLDEAEVLTMPTLVFHGTADTTVPIETSRELARRNDNVDLVEVDDALHVGSWNVDPQGYEERVTGFLDAL